MSAWREGMPIAVLAKANGKSADLAKKPCSNGLKLSDNAYVRCGNLAMESNGVRPRQCLGGACVDESVLGYSAQVPAPDSAHARAMPLLSVCGVFSWLNGSDRTTSVKSGLAWGASQKHRPFYTRTRVVQPVSEGLGKIRGAASGETTPYRVNRCLMGALGCFVWTCSSMGEPMAGVSSRGLDLSKMGHGMRTGSNPVRSTQSIWAGQDGHCHHPWGNYV